jgi:S-formylglutathione hydrolase FrmB
VSRGRAYAWGVVALASLCLSGTAKANPAKIVGEQPVDDGHGIELTISTPAFSAPAKVQVFLPAGYDAQPHRRWPVTYYLHGAQGDQTRFWPWYGDLIKDFPSIVVAPDGGWLGWYSDWYNGGAGGPPMYETYIIDQLIPLIDQRFRTFGTRAERAVIGESMGGYGVMTLATRNPDAWATAVSLSGAVDNSSLPVMALMSGSSTAQEAGQAQQIAAPNGVYGDPVTQRIRWRGHNPVDLASNLRDVVLQVRTFDGAPNPLIENNDPTSIAGCSEENEVHRDSVSFHDQLLADGVAHLWRDYGPGCHGIPEFRREFADSLPGIETVFDHPQPAPKAITYESIEPKFSVFGWNLTADPARALEFLQLRHAGRHGLTLVGSGTTQVTTPPFFKGVKAVDVISDGKTRAVTPDGDGRLRFSVDLGAPHPDQQDTAAARLDGQDSAAYFTTRSVKLVAR